MSYKRMAGVLVLLVALSAGSGARAVSVSVDPGAYAGVWYSANVGYTGPEILDLAAGTHTMTIGSYGGFQVSVQATGSVSVLTPGVDITGGAGTLTFGNMVVDIDPAAFAGDWLMAGVVDWMRGPLTVVLVPGVRYGVNVGGLGGRMFVRLQADGQVVVENGVSGTGGPASLTFNTVDVAVDPGSYAGQWELYSVRSYAPGADTVTLVPGIGPYGLRVGWDFIRFALDGTGFATVTGSAVTGGPASLTFNTIALAVDPGDYAGSWGINADRSRLSAPGAETVHLPRDLEYSVTIGNIGTGRFQVVIDAAGNVTVVNGVSATGGAGSLTFHTTDVLVDVGAFAGSWRIHVVVDFRTGSANAALVPGVNYYLQTNQGQQMTFGVSEPCAVNPSELATPAGPILLSCGLADGDDDGVPDASDNCPSAANADQLDRDDDGLGDACDGDLDGDGWLNEADNCPEAANADQTDGDDDGMGDACDADADGDGVDDASDNCPGNANPDQADSDGDDAGDLCDEDDDGDGLPDDADNCPLAANADQLDFDLDGQGDACDGDTDGDLIGEDTDACPFSPLDRPVDGDGCTGAQRIARNCPRGDFVRHGTYVSCVAHAANQAVVDGLITTTEKAAFVKEAAANK